MHAISRAFKALIDRFFKKDGRFDSRFLTFFVLTNDSARPRQFRVPMRRFKVFGAGAAVCSVILFFIVIDYARLKWDELELGRLKSENSVQKIELLGFASKIRQLESQLAKLNLFDRKLRIITNLDDPKPVGAKPEQLLGMGGANAGDETTFSSTGEKADELVKKMRTDLNDLEARARSQENSFTELQGHLMKQSSILASTPSVWPSRGWVTSSFGSRTSPFTGSTQTHTGIDIANRVGTPVISPANGIVAEAGNDPALGKKIIISHGYGMKTTYGHLSEVFVRVGQKVKRGDKIGTVGNTGRSTGPHLHYEVSLNGLPVNPEKYILN